MKNQKTYLIADTHFNHARLIEMGEGRVPDFEKRIEKGLKAIEPDDILIHLGDVCIGKDEEMHEKYIMPLKCKKILVLGNHDHKSNTWYYKHGWDFVCKTFTGKYFGKTIIFSHIPTLEQCGSTDLCVHGHLHNTGRYEDLPYDGGKRFKLVSMEAQNYKPILIEHLIA